MRTYDYELLISKPAANDVERPFPPSAERRVPSPNEDHRGERGAASSSAAEGERLAA